MWLNQLYGWENDISKLHNMASDLKPHIIYTKIPVINSNLSVSIVKMINTCKTSNSCMIDVL